MGRRVVTVVLVSLIAAASACSDSIADTDEVYHRWTGQRVLCGVGLDDRLGVGEDDLRGGLQRARDRGEVLVLYAHDIGGNGVAPERLESALQLADELGVPFRTMDELHGEPPDDPAGIAITFDDAFIESWYGARDLFASYGARATFFVTRFHRLDESELDMLHELRAAGHAIESHGVNHLDAAVYADELGVRAYVDDEVVPSLERMREAGFDPTTFAYPFGSRTGALDDAILEHVELVRSLSWLFASTPLVNDPCPE